VDSDRGLERAHLGPAEWSAGFLLAALIFLGSLVMWIGIPLGWVWLVSQFADHYPDVYAGALFGCPVTMVLFGLLLARLNGLHMRITGGHSARSRTAWLKSLSGDRLARRPRTVLDTSMCVSVVIAILTIAVWYFFFAHSYTPGLPAP
jgi:hypothetical protein